MCFSAEASFSSAVILTGIGVACVRRAGNSREIPLASIPFIFAVQQMAEGFLWLTFSNSFFLLSQQSLAYLFLTFSHIVWPTWIPLSIFLLEKNEPRKRILKILLALGLVLSAYHIYSLLYFTVTARADQHHIQYIVGHPDFLRMPASVIYGVSAIVPAFISTVRRMWWLGAFIAISYLAAYVLYQAYVISVWCYFATLMSVVVFLILKVPVFRTRPV